MQIEHEGHWILKQPKHPIDWEWGKREFKWNTARRKRGPKQNQQQVNNYPQQLGLFPVWVDLLKRKYTIKSNKGVKHVVKIYHFNQEEGGAGPDAGRVSDRETLLVYHRWLSTELPKQPVPTL